MNLFRHVAWFLLAGMLIAGMGNLALAQLSDDDRTSTRGTQFVRPEAPPPKKEEPPKGDPPPPGLVQPQPAAVKPPEPPPPPPPRYPSVVFLVDTSDSMLNRVDSGKGTRLQDAQQALTQVLEAMSPETRVQVWTFNTGMNPVLVKGIPQGRFIPIGKGDYRKQLIQRVQSLRTAGGTNLFRSVVEALKFFDDPREQALYRSGQRFPVLVVVSDGEDWGKTRETLATVQEEKGKRPLVTVNAIGFTVPRGRGWYKELCRIASRKEGCATADDGPQLRRILESFYRPAKGG